MTEEQQTDEEKEKLKKRNKKFRKKLTKLSVGSIQKNSKIIIVLVRFNYKYSLLN